MRKRTENLINKLIPMLEKLEETDDEKFGDEPKDRALIYQLELRLEWLTKKTHKIMLSFPNTNPKKDMIY